MATPYEQILTSPPFKFFVGDERVICKIHGKLASQHSLTLKNLIEGGMKEAKEECADLKNVDVKTFVRVGEFMYTGDYSVESAEVHLDHANVENGEQEIDVPKVEVEEGEEEELLLKNNYSLGFGFGFNLSRKEKERRSKEPSWRADIPKFLNSADLQKPTSESVAGSTAWDLLCATAIFPAGPAFTPKPNDDPRAVYTEVFLCHARVYVFGDFYEMPQLQRLVLHKLH